VQNFGIDDNFFYLGGNSARAMILVSCLRNHGFALTVADIIRNPVLKEKAKQLKQKIDVADLAPFSQVADTKEECNAIRLHSAKVCRVDTNRVLDIFPITEIQERFFHGAYLGGPLSVWVYVARFMHDSARQMIFNITGDLDIRRFFKAWHAVNERHSILRTRFIQEKDTRQILQVVVDDPIHIWNSCDPLSEDFLRRDRLVKMTLGAPLIRITASQEYRWVVLTISHAIYDGFSLDLIVKEVKREYDQVAGAKPAIEMNHFMKYLGDGDKQAALAFWRNHFAGADVKPVVPHDRLDEETVQNVVKRATVKLDCDLPAGAPNRSIILQVSAALFLAHRLDCADIIFDNHLSGRIGTLPGVEVFVGPTLTSLATRVHIGRDADAPVLNILSETQNFMNTVSEHEHMGWWKLVQMDEFRELLHGAPLLNVMPSPDMTGRNLGLELKKTNSQNEAPYGVMATLVDDNTIELLVCSDKRCVPEAEVEKDLKRWQIALQQVWASCAQANEDQPTVGDVFSHLQDLS
jgi:aryl carrier-like protein